MADPPLPPMPVSLALAALEEPSGLRERLARAARLGFRTVQLDARAFDSRPRDLGRSARRDLAGLMRRSELLLSGVDLWIPPAHFAQPAHVDRAVDAACDAIDFASDIAALAGGRAVVCIVLPSADASDAIAALAEQAISRGVRVADHQWPPREDLAAQPALASIGVGIDPAAVMLGPAGRSDPASEAARAGVRLASARLNDVAASNRAEPGEGRLDLLAYSIAVATAAPGAPLVLDLRALKNPELSARRVLRRFGIEPPD